MSERVVPDPTQGPQAGNRIRIRPADEADVPIIHELIRDLAVYEKLEHEVVATEDDLRRTLFGERRHAEVLLAEQWEEAALQPPVHRVLGFALFFHNYSTFLGRSGIYLEDLYVRPEARGNGIGQGLLRHLAQLAMERNCGRFEWSVLDWNEPAIRFYRRLGAVPMNGWTVFRVTGEALGSLADSSGMGRDEERATER